MKEVKKELRKLIGCWCLYFALRVIPNGEFKRDLSLWVLLNIGKL